MCFSLSLYFRGKHTWFVFVCGPGLCEESHGVELHNLVENCSDYCCYHLPFSTEERFGPKGTVSTDHSGILHAATRI